MALKKKDLKILIVEDDNFSLQFLKGILTGNKCSVARTGEDALEMFRNVRPDIVLLDIVLPKMDGKEVLQKLLDINPGAYVVMVTGDNVSKTVSECVKLGAKGYITKPFSQANIEHALERYLEQLA